MLIGSSIAQHKGWINQRIRTTPGFTLIELMVVMAVLAILASLVSPRFMDRVEVAREIQLRQNLIGLRTAIDQFYRDQSRYPDSLNELVERRYIRAIPQDPVTQRADTWTTVATQDAQGNEQGDANTPTSTSEPSHSQSNGGIFDVHSGASGYARDGTTYAQW